MAWNPEKYNEFKSLRYQPFFDLVSHIKDKPYMEVIDLGCGTGELTQLLAKQLTHPSLSGIDSSPEMLAEAHKYNDEHIHFDLKSIEETLATGKKWDLVFSNAALQWVENHETLLPRIIASLHPEGQIAIQVPTQNENMLNQILLALGDEEPYAAALKHWKRLSPVLSLDDYTRILFKNGGKKITVYQKVYPLIADNHDNLYSFIAGSALVPYFERLEGDIKERFIGEYKNRIKERFVDIPALYAFKRILLHAIF